MYINRQIVMGVDALIHLAEPGRLSATRSGIAGALGFTPGMAGLVLWKLRLAGLIAVHDGGPGRFRLARRPHEVRLSDVFDAMDDERPWRRDQRPALADTLEHLNGPDLVWSGAEACLRLFLGDLTLADLVGGASRFDAASLLVFRRAGGLPDWSAEL